MAAFPAAGLKWHFIPFLETREIKMNEAKNYILLLLSVLKVYSIFCKTVKVTK
jgi:hypothetical protein